LLVEVVSRLAADKAGNALRRQPGLFGGTHDAAHLVADVTGGVALGLAQRRPFALAVLMPAAVARAVAAFAAELALAVAAVARAVALFAAEWPFSAAPSAWACLSFMDNNRNPGQFAFSLCIYPALAGSALLVRRLPAVPGPYLFLSSTEYILNNIQCIFNTPIGLS